MLAETEVENELLLYENGEDRKFLWHKRDAMSQRMSGWDESSWEEHVACVKFPMKDEFLNYSLKMDLIDHVWAESGFFLK